MLKAVIFDFDGIIVDTEPIHYRAFQEILVPLGMAYSWNDYITHYMGFDDREAFAEVYKSNGQLISEEKLLHLINRKGAIFEKIICDGVKPYPGALALIRVLSGEIPLALCSGALPSDIEPILKQLNISDAFDVIVTAAEVAASKPDPESYLLAFSRLVTAFTDMNITPGECLAIEDTPAGIASANGAGISVLAVTNSYPAGNLSEAVRIIESLESVNLKYLHDIFNDYLA